MDAALIPIAPFIPAEETEVLDPNTCPECLVLFGHSTDCINRIDPIRPCF